MIELLKGVKILDLSRLLPGPLCSLFLADMGADVLKIEDTGAGDYTRWDLPKIKENSAFFLMLNRNKKSMRLNLKEQDGYDILCELVKDADVVIEQFRPGVAEKLKVDYKTLSKINPGLVYCSITGYGQDGPYRDKAGHDLNYIGFSGLLGQTGWRKGRPIIPGTQVADQAGGSLMAVMGILAALIGKSRTGRGEYVDVSMMDGTMSLMVIALGSYFGYNNVLERGESLLTGSSPCYDVYETKDGKFMALGAFEAKFWKSFCVVVDRPDLIEKQFPKVEELDEVRKEVEGIFKQKTRDEWVDCMAGVDACCTPVLELDETVENEQVKARNMIFEMDHPFEGRIKQIGFPLKFGNSKFEVNMPAPMLGEHTDEILSGLGLTAEKIEELRQKKVI